MPDAPLHMRARALLAAWRAELHRSYVVHGVPGVVYADADVARDIAELDEVIGELAAAEARAPISDERIDRFLDDLDYYSKMPLYDDRFRERSRGKVHALLFEAVASASQRDSLSAEVVNRAGILASDMPHAVVDKLRAALRKD